MQNVQMTILEAVQIKIPGILKSHPGDAERMSAGAIEKDFPTSETRPGFLNAWFLFTAGPELSLELTSFKNRLSARFRSAARLGGIMKGPRHQFPACHEHEIPVERTESVLCRWWFEMLRFDPSLRLRLNPSDDLGNGNPVFVFGRPGCLPK